MWDIYKRSRVSWQYHQICALFEEQSVGWKGTDRDVWKKGERLLQMSRPNLHEWQRTKLQGMGKPPATLLPHTLFWGELKKGVVMPMTASHSADRDQWLMKGFGSPPGISHSLPPWQLHPAFPALQHYHLVCPRSPAQMEANWSLR